ncbi:hypothetical protein L1987_10428 [Smallanthus sonchifolius]|uniref:Uncharacterized protein n=1 Tax=Smallanthus sonchifolius TaxID=185202 RepID=A0ACB9JSE6_9ASTR|nr:hypothetical protein L1987_10428 [Smallanthus sonchifolius]
MEMEFMAEFTEGMSRDRARQIIKRRRTKRQRPSSPFGTSTTSGNSTADGDCFIDNQSPVMMSSEMSTEEDEEMANCLILLAQSISPFTEEKSDQIRQKTVKLSSRRFTEPAASTAGGKIGFYAYECKTCNRTFPSFQALGGHRASHKKPKVNVEEKKTNSANIPPPLTEYSEEDHDQQKTSPESGMLSLDLNFPPPEVADDVQSKFQFTGGSSQQHLVFSAPALVDCHY